MRSSQDQCSTLMGSSDDARSLLLDEAKGSGHQSIENWRHYFPEIIGRSSGMLKVLETVSKISRSDSAVLILGESGTGKELIASAIHRLSHRSHMPYVTLNCSAIPEALLESELFGHEKGAFTGADKTRKGHFEAAGNGTIFLDEIGDMPFALQAKLLRVLQDKRFTRLGGTEPKEADVRIIAATNKNLEHAVKRENFRLDLYYRLNVLPVYIPPLRERRDDIPALLEHFIEIANRMHHLPSPCYLTDETVRRLCELQWPGNVRQLQNVVDRLVIMKGGGGIHPSDLEPEMIDALDPESSFAEPVRLSREPSSHLSPIAPRPINQSSPGVRYPANFGELPVEGLDLANFIENLENDLIRQALERTGNNKNQAARLLGLNRTTLVERIKKRRLQPLNEPSKEL